jgi:hypothetical protein
MRMVALEPPIGQDEIVAAAEELRDGVLYGSSNITLVVDVAGSLGVVAALANRFGVRQTAGLRITAALEHALTPEPLILSRQPPLAVPCWHVSRSRLLDGLRRAASAGMIHLPLEDPEQRQVLHELRRELEGIAEQVTPAGRVLGVADGRDDLVLALSYAVWALNGPVGVFAARAQMRGTLAPTPSAKAWT